MGSRPHATQYTFVAMPEALELFQPSCEVESLACQCLIAGSASFEDFASMILLLPADAEGKVAGSSQGSHESPKTFTSGAYVYSNRCGLRSNTYRYSATTCLLARVVGAVFPDQPFTSVGLFRNLQTPPHSDTNNDPRTLNLILPASQFRGGAVWFEGNGHVSQRIGEECCYGDLLHVAHGPCLLDSQQRHCTLDWTGARILIVAFSVKNSGSLRPDAAERLSSFGFSLPRALENKRRRTDVPGPGSGEELHALPDQCAVGDEPSLLHTQGESCLGEARVPEPGPSCPDRSERDTKQDGAPFPPLPLVSDLEASTTWTTTPCASPSSSLKGLDLNPVKTTCAGDDKNPGRPTFTWGLDTKPASRLPDGRPTPGSSSPPLGRVLVHGSPLPNAVFPAQTAPLVIEVFAGTARLSQACHRVGFRTLAVDKSSKKSRHATHVLDLTVEADVTALLDIITLEASNLALVHLAPPCGTGSAARGRPIPEAEAMGLPVPQPLRSPREPQGLSTLSGTDLVRVQLANSLCRAVGRVVRHCLDLGVRVTVENPKNSLAWLCDGLDELFRLPQYYEILFHACVHGSDRNKSTLFWASDHLFSSLGVLCDGSHPHASWKPVWSDGGWRYPTAEEAAYPWLLCERIAHILAAEYPDLANTAYQVRLPDQVALQRQPRYAKPLVSAFAAHDTWAVVSQAADLLLKAYPKGAHVVRRKLVPWGVVRVCLPSMCPLLDRQALKQASVSDKSFEIMDGQHEACVNDIVENPADVHKVVGEVPPANGCAESAELVQIGIPRESQDFVNEAIKAGHPRDMLSVCRSGPAKEVANAVLYPRESRVAKARKTITEWARMKESTSRENVEMLKDRPEYIRKILGNKNLLFWKQALTVCDFPDTELWWDMCQGFRLTGWTPDTKLFARHLRPPATDLDRLLSQSSYRTPLTLRAISKTVVDEASTGAWRETCEEERRGWIFRDDHYNPDRVVLSDYNRRRK